MSSANKHILVVYYSQTGQLQKMVQQVCKPLAESGQFVVDEIELQPVEKFPFPWPWMTFFNVFPECVYLDPPDLQPLNIRTDADYDLVLLAYQPWFLSPSLPVTAFLQSPQAKALLAGKPVITLVACRNMWTQAHLAILEMLDNIGARLIDNVVLTAQGSTMASFITTPRWLLTGNKNSFLGLPEAGVAKTELDASCRFGMAIRDGLLSNLEQTGRPLLTGLRAVKADVGLIQSEKIGMRSFRIWGKLLRMTGNKSPLTRKFVLFLYIIFLICLILTVVPVVSLLKWITRPLLKRQHQKIVVRFEQPSGSGNERMERYQCPK